MPPKAQWQSPRGKSYYEDCAAMAVSWAAGLHSALRNYENEYERQRKKKEGK